VEKTTPQRGEFGELLRRLRLDAGLSQEELAERATLSKRGIADLERGARRPPHPATIRHLALALGLSDTERVRLVDAARDHRLPLPGQASRLVGRHAELAAVCERLRQDRVRLLTLVGTAGVGKTRLAMAAATELADSYADGVCVVYLAPVDDASSVMPALARSVGVRGSEVDVGAYLRRRQLLIVLDNCEHVLAAAPHVAALLETCPRLDILATSRSPLQLRREDIFQVSLLRVPTAEALKTGSELLEVPSVALFVQRARQVFMKPDFDFDPETLVAIGQLCARLEGLPLAIELAAARTRLLPPGAILKRLSRPLDVLVGGPVDDPSRHRTLRNALDWSYALLSATERQVFERIGCFAGGCTLDAAESVCGGVDEVEPILASLLDHSLLQAESSGAREPRVAMLDTVRAFALEKLDTGGKLERCRSLHAAYFLEFVETASVELRGPDQVTWLNRLDREWANIRSALELLAQRAAAGDAAAAEQGLRMGAALWWYMHVRGLYAEVRALLQPLVDAPVSSSPPRTRARALRVLGIAAWGIGDYATGRAEVEAGLAMSRGVSDLEGVGLALIALAGIGVSQADPRLADAASEALELAEAIGDAWTAGWALTFLGLFAIAAVDLDSARASFDRALHIREQSGDVFGLAWARQGLASVERLAGNLQLAEPLFSAALATFCSLGERPTVATILDSLGDIALVRGDHLLARARFDEALTLYLDMDSPRGVGVALAGLAAVAAAYGHVERALRLGGAAATLHQQRGQAGGPRLRADNTVCAKHVDRRGDEAAEPAQYEMNGQPLEAMMLQRRR
jgi:predicted ATPase/DNA-binding XRE family transcriptional regulator